MQYLSIGQNIIQGIKQTSYLEWLGAATTIACVYLAARQNIWNWLAGIIAVTAYMVVFFQSGLFGDAYLQIYFLGTGVYGWYFWLRKKERQEKPVISLSHKEYLLALLITLLLSGLLGLYLQHFTSSTVPYIDGFCTSVSFMAQLLMTRKILQNWALWVFVDICYVPLYIYKNLYVTAILYVILLVLATIGYIDWNKEYKAQALSGKS
ncbi:nicotinamide riboside transporter PnuC [Mucilaginibacter sp. KACC 22773]|uniref:nicotinamide riboside transporter PnuC n=1 Tax=Mucilaginibacter sp. KACC 22773 TaxID=3025671 RepID=UPI0023654120|nr:nicotinamide riboside transporter PnuC [Mucilaginibacter sp. KACC 22773]WDF77850.1 nicotinamide riboside transporter PnuC [Mucilaginibacter sp. KACC 22773]